VGPIRGNCAWTDLSAIAWAVGKQFKGTTAILPLYLPGRKARKVLLWFEIHRKSRSIMLLTIISGHDFAGNQRRNSIAPEISGSRFGQRTHPSLCSHVERGPTSVWASAETMTRNPHLGHLAVTSGGRSDIECPSIETL
jgi:hypothetical protein